MCQCVLCDCCWCNVCGIPCAGWLYSLCFCSCWLFKPEDLQKLNDKCCVIGECTGLGGNFFCCGEVWCAPDYIKQWSAAKKQGK